MFGTLDDEFKYYNKHIILFEQNSEDTSTLKHQLTVVRSSLGAVNNTLADVEYNVNLMTEGINRVSTYMTNLNSETNEKTSILSAKIEFEEHILSAVRTVQRNVGLFIDSVTYLQKGVLQPKIACPFTPMEALRESPPSQKISPCLCQ